MKERIKSYQDHKRKICESVCDCVLYIRTLPLCHGKWYMYVVHIPDDILHVKDFSHLFRVHTVVIIFIIHLLHTHTHNVQTQSIIYKVMMKMASDLEKLTKEGWNMCVFM